MNTKGKGRSQKDDGVFYIVFYRKRRHVSFILAISFALGIVYYNTIQGSCKFYQVFKLS